MGVPTSEVGYTSATARRGNHESSYEHVVALEKKKKKKTFHAKCQLCLTAVLFITWPEERQMERWTSTKIYPFMSFYFSCSHSEILNIS